MKVDSNGVAIVWQNFLMVLAVPIMTEERVVL